MIEELCTNAGKSARGRPVRIEIDADQGPDGTVLRVSDDGPGIPPENIEKVWTPRFTTTPNGTGFGLPMVQKVVRLHGGRVDLASSKDGTTVRICLPGGRD